MPVATRLLLGLALGATALVPAIAPAATFKTLHSFQQSPDGGNPVATLVLSSAGALFGTAYHGGIHGVGTVFEFDPATKKFTVLHAFTDGADGGNPVASVMLGADGALYGTTSHGGGSGCNGYGCGTVFKLVPGTKQLTVLHRFTGGSDGSTPYGGLVADTTGQLYGTATGNGAYGYGTVFKVDPSSGKLTVLHAFTYGNDGGIPRADLVFDTKGMLYGTTAMGGDATGGVAFKLDPKTKALTPLHSYEGGSDASSPYSGLVFHGALLYGASYDGGGAYCNYYGCGTVYSLSPSDGTLTVLHAFTGGAGGKSLYGKVVFDKTGALYDTTAQAGTGKVGTVFELTAAGKLVTLHEFTNGADGGTPQAGLALDSKGTLYGVTSGGGAQGQGTLFSIVP